jgi:hypothetical protein
LVYLVLDLDIPLYDVYLSLIFYIESKVPS